MHKVQQKKSIKAKLLMSFIGYLLGTNLLFPYLKLNSDIFNMLNGLAAN